MDTNKKHIQDLTDKIMEESSLESPPFNFTANVMSQLQKQTIRIAYKPLISKKVWALVAACILIVVVFTFNNSVSESSWLDMISFTGGFNYSLEGLIPNLEIPKTYVYSLVFLALFILIQIPYIKYINNKRLQF